MGSVRGSVRQSRKDRTNAKEASQKGPPVYENWKVAPHNGVVREYPLFTEARCVGEIRSALGPYEVLNLVRSERCLHSCPALTLRISHRLGLDLSPLRRGKTDTTRYHGGELQDELASLLSLEVGTAFKAGGMTRAFDTPDPKGRPTGTYADENPAFPPVRPARPVMPRMTTQVHISSVPLLSRLPDLQPIEAVHVVRSARMFQDGIWVAESQPEMAWLLLVSAVETAAEYWRKEKAPPLERMASFKPELVELLMEVGGKALATQVAEQIADYMGATQMFVDFLLKFKPKAPTNRPPKAFRVSWLNRNLSSYLKKIYSWRSRALHAGIAFPAPMCLPPMSVKKNTFSEKPMGLVTQVRSGIWKAGDTPMLLHTFAHIVRGALLKWWASMLPPSSSVRV